MEMRGSRPLVRLIMEYERFSRGHNLVAHKHKINVHVYIKLGTTQEIIIDTKT